LLHGAAVSTRRCTFACALCAMSAASCSRVLSLDQYQDQCPDGKVMEADGKCTPIPVCGANDVPVAGADAGCEPVGVLPSRCGDGFVSDGNGGCNAIVPATCDPGQVAVLNDIKCTTQQCGTPTAWSPPAEATRVYVQATASEPADGTIDHPFATITTALS